MFFLNSYGESVLDTASLNMFKSMVTEEVSLGFSIKQVYICTKLRLKIYIVGLFSQKL